MVRGGGRRFFYVPTVQYVLQYSSAVLNVQKIRKSEPWTQEETRTTGTVQEALIHGHLKDEH